MKRKFRWWLTAILLYLFSVPTIFVLIGLFTLPVFLLVLLLVATAICGCIYVISWHLFFTLICPFCPIDCSGAIKKTGGQDVLGMKVPIRAALWSPPQAGSSVDCPPLRQLPT